MISDIALDDGFFDPDFFMYREDVDVARRSQLLGWHRIYTPGAVAYHARGVVPRSRIFRTSDPQDAFGEKPVFDACQEHEVR